MRKLKFFFCLLSLIITIAVSGQKSLFDSCSFFNPCPRHYEVKHAIEAESLFPMFFYGGYHFAVGYRYKNLRIRTSIINGGSYDAEPAGIHNNAKEYKRFYSKMGYGLFLGYNVWKTGKSIRTSNSIILRFCKKQPVKAT